MHTEKAFDPRALERGIASYGNAESAACDKCMSEAMRKCGDKPHDQAVAIAISECRDKCPTQPRNDDDAPEPPAPISGGS